MTSITSQNLTTDLDLSQNELVSLLDLAADVKRSPAAYSSALNHRVIGLLFEKPSLRTRMTFEVAAKSLGGDAILSVGPIGGREPVKDVARNLERWTQCIVARTFSQATVDELARAARVPVINALSDLYHPCQALADMQTLKEHWGDCRGRKLTFIGDGNNVAHSLMLNCARLGIHFALANPPGYDPKPAIVETARRFAAAEACTITLTHDPAEALRDSAAVYTDVWASMGWEQEASDRARAFAPYQVDDRLFSMARPDAIFMHCLPAHRDEEVTDSVMESPRSAVFDQAENRLHAQKALLLMLLSAPRA